MAKIDTLDDRKKGDRLTAQLGLGAAEQVEIAGACLNPDQLADVATNHCSQKEREAALAHFSSCRKCYDAWVAVSLSLVAMESGLERRQRPLLSLRNMGYLGSALAIAASVVLFVNIKGDLIRTTIEVPAEKAVEQLHPSDAAIPQQRMSTKEEAATSTQVSAPPLESPKKASKAGMSTAKPEPKSAEVEGMLAPQAAAPAPPVLADQAALRSESESGISSAEWLSGLLHYCREERYHDDPARWNLLHEEGLAIRDNEVDPVFSEKMTAILAVMTSTAKEDDIMAQCGVILSLLAGGDKKG